MKNYTTKQENLVSQLRSQLNLEICNANSELEIKNQMMLQEYFIKLIITTVRKYIQGNVDTSLKKSGT